MEQRPISSFSCVRCNPNRDLILLKVAKYTLRLAALVAKPGYCLANQSYSGGARTSIETVSAVEHPTYASQWAEPRGSDYPFPPVHLRFLHQSIEIALRRCARTSHLVLTSSPMKPFSEILPCANSICWIFPHLLEAEHASGIGLYFL